MTPDSRALFLFNGRDAMGRQVCLRCVEGRVIDAQPQPGDLRVDLGGSRLLPGLINAHDHLQLNDLPRLKYRPVYDNATQWIADIDPRLDEDPMLRAHRAVPRPQRLLMGGVKNLLSGATTVVHHDPCYASLVEPSFPVRVLTGYGWSHSLALDGDEAVQAACRATPPGCRWIIHAAEGTDAAAAAEFDRLESLACIGPDAVLVHGLGLSTAQQRRLALAGGGLVWCPGSNLHLFGRTLDPDALARLPHLALGSDSRISGEQDLLAELRLARRLAALDEATLEGLVTDRAAAVFGLQDRGALAPGHLADVLVLPADRPLGQAERADVRLVLVGGQPRYADPDLGAAFGPSADLVQVTVDGRRKLLAVAVVEALQASPLQEPGLGLDSRVQEHGP